MKKGNAVLNLGCHRWLAALALAVLALPAAFANNGMTLQQLATIRSVASAQISPDGTQIAYVLSVPRVPGVEEDGPARTELHLVDRAGHDRLYVDGQSAISPPQWLPDGSALLFLSKREGDKTRSLYRLPAHGGEARKLLALAADISAFDVSADGRQVALLAGAPESAARQALREHGFTQKVYEEDWRPQQVWIFDLSQTASPRVLDIEGSVQQVQWSPAGDRLALAVTPRQLTDDTLMFARIRIVSPEGVELGRVDNPGKLGVMAWSCDGEHLAFITAADIHDPQQGRLGLTGKSGGEWRDLLPELPGHVIDIGWNRSHRLRFISHEGVLARLGEVSIDGDTRTLLPLGGPIWTRLSIASSGDLALIGSTPLTPSEVFHLPAAAPATQRLTHSNPWLDGIALAQQEIVHYQARDGLGLEGLLIRPLKQPESAPVPLLVVVHGGPESHYSNGWLSAYSQPAQTAAAQGYAVFFPNYRSSTGRGVAFSKLGFGKPGMEEFDDVVDGVDHLIATGLVDKDKVGITGGSYGGYASAWGATYYSERFAAAVMFVGISDQASLVMTGDIPQEQYLVHMGVWPWDHPELFRNASPISYASKSRTPTLILHGEADPRVPPMQSYLLYRYLKLAGQAPVRLVLYPGEGHGNRRAASRYDYSLRLLRWFDHYLKGSGGAPPPYELEYALPARE